MEHVRTAGYAVMRSMFDMIQCGKIVDRVNQLSLVQAQACVGATRQQFHTLRCHVDEVDPILGNFGRDLGELLAPHHPPMSEDNWPNEITLNRYDGAGFIGPHRDHACYKHLVAIVSLAGEGTFSVYSRRPGSPIKRTEVLPLRQGDLVLLGTPSFGRRVTHSVRSNSPNRISLSFRFISD